MASEADPAGVLWTHPNGIGFRHGVYGLGLNAHPLTGGYPHSHGLPHGLGKREAEAKPEAAGVLWTHPNGIGFRSGVYGLGLNSYAPAGGYPHSHGIPHGHIAKREAEAEPAYYGYYRGYGPLNGLGYLGHTGSIHGGGYGLRVLGKREADPAVSYEYRSPQGARGYFPYLHPYGPVAYFG